MTTIGFDNELPLEATPSFDLFFFSFRLPIFCFFVKTIYGVVGNRRFGVGYMVIFTNSTKKNPFISKPL